MIPYRHSLLACGAAGELETRLRHRDGGHRRFEFAGTPLDAGADMRWIDTMRSEDLELAREVWRRTPCAEEGMAQ
jgi:hypothetical protein